MDSWGCAEKKMRTAWSNKEAASVDLWRRMHRVRGTRKDSGRRTKQGEWLPVKLKGGFFSPPPVQCVCYTSNQQLCTSETCTTSATSTPWGIKVGDNFILHSFDGSKTTNVWHSIECVIQQLLLCARYPSQDPCIQHNRSKARLARNRTSVKVIQGNICIPVATHIFN